MYDNRFFLINQFRLPNTLVFFYKIKNCESKYLIIKIMVLARVNGQNASFLLNKFKDYLLGIKLTGFVMVIQVLHLVSIEHHSLKDHIILIEDI